MEKGIEGETRSYNGTDYTYNGPADMEVTENEDGTVYYDFTLRDDRSFGPTSARAVSFRLCENSTDGAFK